tara:strand:+ start:153 stop:644 length:492 start_codon:yes stop_codon:yes gene_type:complete
MRLIKTKLKDIYEISLETFTDFRGKYTEIYNKKFLEKFNINFIQDDISTSRYSVIRGIHGDFKTWKLVTCLYGSFYLIVIDNRKNSKQFGSWTSFTLTSENNKQILIPPGFGNGHQVLTKEAIFHYKQNTMYDRKSQFTIKYNDPKFKFVWPISNPILSDRDK